MNGRSIVDVVRAFPGRAFRWIRRQVRRQRGLLPRPPQRTVLIACHHRSGSTLMHNVLGAVCAEFEWKYRDINGLPSQLPRAEVVFLRHGLLAADLGPDDVAAIHVVRDPRDVVVSGYQYHRATDEPWCINDHFQHDGPIRFPLVDYSQEHWPEERKQAYLDSLAGRSYQRNVLELPRDEGIRFEIEGFAGWTATQMVEFQERYSFATIIRFEDISADFDSSFRRIFELIGIDERWIERALEVAQIYDLKRLSPSVIASDPKTVNRGTRRWPDILTADHLELIEERFGDAIVALGYAGSGDDEAGSRRPTVTS